MSFDHTGGDEGLRLVPDLAAALPMPTDDGRTYTFRLRPGIRYSNGDPVRASDFRAAIERLFRAGSPGTDFYLSIVGTKRCEAAPRRCNLAHGIVTDDASGTIVFHLTAPDPEFLYQLTEQDYSAPVPPGTPGRDTGLHPFPGTGPYEITQADGEGVTFARNPYFREWSHAAQPEGDPDTIRWRYFPTVQMAVAAVQAGQAQWLNGEIPARSEARVALDSPAQLHTHPLFGVEFLALNTRRPPFTSALARRALNYAINRNAIADMYGGSGFATPACQPIAPGLPGY